MDFGQLWAFIPTHPCEICRRHPAEEGDFLLQFASRGLRILEATTIHASPEEISFFFFQKKFLLCGLPSPPSPSRPPEAGPLRRAADTHGRPPPHHHLRYDRHERRLLLGDGAPRHHVPTRRQAPPPPPRDTRLGAAPRGLTHGSRLGGAAGGLRQGLPHRPRPPRRL